MFFLNNLSNNFKKGLTFGVIGTILVGLQPVIANSAKSIDPHAFAAMTCLIQMAIFLPLVIIESQLNKRKENGNPDLKTNNSILLNWKKHFWLLLIIGIIFSLNQFLFFIGYRLAGAVNGSLTQKTSVFFALLYGYLLLKEKITKIQILFSIVLFFGLVIAISQGSFDFSIDILTGVLIVLLITALWMLGHTLTKRLFNRKEMTPIQMGFIRNMLSGAILIGTFFVFSPLEINAFLDPYNQFFFIIMGTVYAAGLFCWYKTLSYLDVSNASIVLSPTPIVTAIFASIILADLFTVFHLIGSVLVIVSIVIIVKQKRD